MGPAGRNWIIVLCICTVTTVGAQAVSAEVPLAEAEAVVLGSARREPKTSYACPSPADGQELQPQAQSGHTRLLTAAGGLRGSKESQGHLNGQTSAPLTECSVGES